MAESNKALEKLGTKPQPGILIHTNATLDYKVVNVDKHSSSYVRPVHFPGDCFCSLIVASQLCDITF